MSYNRLTEAERWHIQAYHNSGNSIGWIARKLKRALGYRNRARILPLHCRV
jgi:IS30 family transposase